MVWYNLSFITLLYLVFQRNFGAVYAIPWDRVVQWTCSKQSELLRRPYIDWDNPRVHWTWMAHEVPWDRLTSPIWNVWTWVVQWYTWDPWDRPACPIRAGRMGWTCRIQLYSGNDDTLGKYYVCQCASVSSACDVCNACEVPAFKFKPISILKQKSVHKIINEQYSLFLQNVRKGTISCKRVIYSNALRIACSTQWLKPFYFSILRFWVINEDMRTFSEYFCEIFQYEYLIRSSQYFSINFGHVYFVVHMEAKHWLWKALRGTTQLEAHHKGAIVCRRYTPRSLHAHAPWNMFCCAPCTNGGEIDCAGSTRHCKL